MNIEHLQSPAPKDFVTWQHTARELLGRQVKPDDVFWKDPKSPLLPFHRDLVSKHRELVSKPVMKQAALPLGIALTKGGFMLRSDAAASGASFVADGEEAAPLLVPRRFLKLAQLLSCHRTGAQWNILYRVLWRLTHGERNLLDIPVDGDVSLLNTMEKQIDRDIHKMTAFVRFQLSEVDGKENWVAWHKPDHKVLALVVPFFLHRFGSSPFSLFTPDQSVSWNTERLIWGEGVARPPHGDAGGIEELWKTYYASVFNPARLSVKAMKTQMPARFWQSMPETALIPQLVQSASSQVDKMVEQHMKHVEHSRSAPARVGRVSTSRKTANGGAVELDLFTEDAGSHRTESAPASDDAWSIRQAPAEPKSIEQLRKAAKGCTACPLFRDATQTVFGEGSPNSKVVFVGEQPGDEEDRAGQPFIGPAGRLLSRAFEEAGIKRDKVYITNAVKHFKWIPRGKRRLHQKPNGNEIHACRQWLESELNVIEPELVVCLGATAAQSLFGRAVAVMKERGKFTELPDGRRAFITIHPSAILRIPDKEAQEDAFRLLVEELQMVRSEIEELTH